MIFPKIHTWGVTIYHVHMHELNFIVGDWFSLFKSYEKFQSAIQDYSTTTAKKSQVKNSFNTVIVTVYTTDIN